MRKNTVKEVLAEGKLQLGTGFGQLRSPEIPKLLAAAGFQRVPQVEDRGEFAVRGGIVDVFPAGVTLPLRLQFEGDVLESVRGFDAATQCSVSAARNVVLRGMPPDALSARRATASPHCRQSQRYWW